MTSGYEVKNGRRVNVEWRVEGKECGWGEDHWIMYQA